MKKLLFFAATFIFTVLVFNANAQQSGRGGNNADRQSEMRERVKKYYIDSLGFSEEKATKVLEIESQFTEKKREIRQDQTLTQEEKQTKIKEINEQINEKLKPVLTSEELTKYQDAQKRMMMRVRQGQGKQWRAHSQEN